MGGHAGRSARRRGTARAGGRTKGADGAAPGAVAVLAPVAVALLLTPWRDRLAAADNALILVVVIVAVATAGQRWAAAVCAVASALAFDFLLTRPYGSFRISRTSDLVTELLLLVVGLAVGDLAARGRTQRVAAWQGRRHLAVLHNVYRHGGGGVDPDEVVLEAGRGVEPVARAPLVHLPSGETGLAARSSPTVRCGSVRWSGRQKTSASPTAGWTCRCAAAVAVLGHFVLLPVPGTRVAPESL